MYILYIIALQAEDSVYMLLKKSFFQSITYCKVINPSGIKYHLDLSREKMIYLHERERESERESVCVCVCVEADVKPARKEVHCGIYWEFSF